MVRVELLLMILCLFFSCKNKENRGKVGVNGDVACIFQDSLVNGTCGLVDTVRYIKLETTNDCLLGRLTKLEMYDGKFFIQDINQNLYVFLENGQFLAKIGQKGRGGEEYAAMAGFCLDKTNNLVGIADPVGEKLIYYDFKGQFVKKVSGDNLGFLLSSVQYKDVLLNFYTCFFQVVYSMQMYDVENMELTASLHPHPMNRTASSDWANRAYAETSDGITFIKPLSDTIFQYDGTTVKPRFILEHALPLATKSVCNAFNSTGSDKGSFYGFLAYLSVNNYFLSILSIYETSNYLFVGVKTEPTTITRIVWNKNQGKGRYEGSLMYVDEKYPYRPFIHNLISSTDDYFIGVYYDFEINRFAETEYKVDSEMREIVSKWNEGDNPVIALFSMKEEI